MPSLRWFSENLTANLTASICCLAASWGCSPAPKPEAAAPPIAAAPTASPAASAEAAPPSAAEPAPEAAPSTEPPPAAAAEPEPARPTQSPLQVISAPDVAFLVDYAGSAARERALDECDTEAKGDPAVKATCLEKARTKFIADVIRFKKDAQGKFQLAIYKRQGSRLDEIYIGSVELTEQGTDAVRLKFTGREKGARPLFRGQPSVVLKVPTEYSIEIDDAGFGRVTYNAKIGLVSQ